jgi:tetratricopeptide (TPR) repeat protein
MNKTQNFEENLQTEDNFFETQKKQNGFIKSKDWEGLLKFCSDALLSRNNSYPHHLHYNYRSRAYKELADLEMDPTKKKTHLEEAGEDLKRAIIRLSGKSYDDYFCIYHNSLASVYKRRDGEFHENVIKEYQKAADYKSGDVYRRCIAYEKLAKIEMGKKNFDNALKNIDASINLDEKQPYAVKLKGDLYLQDGKSEDALKYYLRAEELNHNQLKCAKKPPTLKAINFSNSLSEAIVAARNQCKKTA